MNKYGYNYAMKFKQNAENFVNFYLTSKQRNHKNINEALSLSSLDKNNQNDIKNLKLCLNDELNSKNNKKFFEIIKENSVGDGSKCASSLTHSQSMSSDGNSDHEENEKSEKENQTFLNKKRSSMFNVFLYENENGIK